MALVNNGTRVSIPSNLIPSTFSPPAVTEFADQESIRTLSLNILKATVDEATQAATLLAIITNGTIGIAKQIDDIIAADYISTNAVTYWINWKTLSSNATRNATSDFLTNVAASYVVTVDVHIKTV